MDNNNKISAPIIGQIALMQSVITQLPNISSVMEFVCRGLKDIPGVQSVIYAEIFTESINPDYYHFSIGFKETSYGSLNFCFSNRESGQPYIPYIDNLCRVIAIIFEEKKHRKQNQQILRNLEKIVEERTKSLEEQIEKRVRTEDSLRQSEKKLSFALTASNSGIWDWNLLDNNIIFDDNYYIIAGYTPKEFPYNYNEWKKRVHPKDFPDVEDSINAYLRGDIKKFSVQFRFKRKNNKWMWLLGQGEIYSYKNGKPERFIGTHIDIDYQKKVELRLERATNFISNIIDSMPSIIIGIDKRGVITQWNREALNKTNITQTEAKGQKILDLLPYLQNNLKPSLTSLEIYESQTTFRLEHIVNGTTVYERVTTYPLSGKGVKGAVIRIDDVSNLHAIQEKLNHRQKMESIGQLAGGVAHDFNNILSGIIGAAQLLESPIRGVKEQNLKYVELIIKSSSRAADLTAKLLQFGRKGSVISTTLNIYTIINDTVALLRRTINKDIDILFTDNANMNTITGDSSAIQSVLMNIGINASHAMKSGGKIEIKTINRFLNKEFCVSSSFDIEPGNYIEITIADNGSGIEKENLNLIFEPFFTTKRIGEGTGLGLSAAYGTIVEHKGAISVKSELGKGTSFTILIPCNATNFNEIKLVEEEHKGSGHILLIDDEDSIRVITKHLLEELGYTVTIAQDGLQGLEIFKKEYKSIDLVIMDVIMPKMNGREAFYKLKEIDRSCKIIISTGFPKDEDINELKLNGVTDYIKKPYTKSELGYILKRALNNNPNL